jgi:hypothetical protein
MMEHNEKWNVTLVDWKTFAEAVVGRSGRYWKENLLTADLVIGGVNFTNNFL